MSGQEIRLDPSRADRGGRDLADAGHDIAGVRATLGGAIDAAGRARPWGSDDIGDQFDRHYRAAAASLMDAWTTIAAYVEALGAASVRTVAELTAADDRAGDRAGDRVPGTYR